MFKSVCDHIFIIERLSVHKLNFFSIEYFIILQSIQTIFEKC